MITDLEIGQQITELRNARNMSQSTLRLELSFRGHDLDASAISRMESGQRLIKATEMVALADIFAVTVDNLVPRESPADRIKRLEARLDRIERQRRCLLYEANGIQAELDALTSGAAL